MVRLSASRAPGWWALKLNSSVIELKARREAIKMQICFKLIQCVSSDSLSLCVSACNKLGSHRVSKWGKENNLHRSEKENFPNWQDVPLLMGLSSSVKVEVEYWYEKVSKQKVHSVCIGNLDFEQVVCRRVALSQLNSLCPPSHPAGPKIQPCEIRLPWIITQKTHHNADPVLVMPATQLCRSERCVTLPVSKMPHKISFKNRNRPVFAVQNRKQHWPSCLHKFYTNPV